MATQTIAYEKIEAFPFHIKYSEIDRYSPDNTFDSHIHPQCEIYVNLSGNVSFMVEDRIYPISRGSIIITRPHEYHHCIYHGDELHKHFWILFSADGNEAFLDLFFRRPTGENNLLTLSEEKTSELIRLCQRMTEPPVSEAEKYYHFFSLIHLLESARITNTVPRNDPEDLTIALEYISAHLAEPISIRQLTDAAFVSINTLERHFSEHLSMTPSIFIRKKRLAHAARLLLEGHSVTESCGQSGFSDYPNFIAQFRKAYGITPLQYQKKYRKAE